MADSRKIKYFESGLYIVLLIIVLLVPFLSSKQFGERNWDWVVHGWLRFVPFLFVFLVCNYLLAPKFLLKKKYISYIISCILLVVLVMFAEKALFYKEKKLYPFPQEIRDKEKKSETCFHHIDTIQKRPVEFSQRKPPMRFPANPIFNLGGIIIYFLLIGFNSGIKFFVWWNEEQNRQKEREKQLLNAELAYLRYQINPHFFMNTLNNIHSLVDINSERAKEAIIKLSCLMRYLLYESDLEKTSLTKEIEFIESYIELMRLRYDENQLTINLNYPKNTDTVYIPSLLFISFIENAFKHGINIKKQSLIEIIFKIENDRLILYVQNNNFARQAVNGIDESSGIGLENIRKRLQLTYKDDYVLSIDEDNNWYQITLNIPII